jgi:hypothetical protein
MIPGNQRFTRSELPDASAPDELVPVPMAVVVVVVVVAIVPAPAIAVPVVIVLEAPAVAFPVPLEESTAIMMRHDPARSRIWRPGPISVVPLVVMADRIPVALDPDVLGGGTRGQNADYTGWWRRADLYSNRYLSAQRSRGQEKQTE